LESANLLNVYSEAGSPIFLPGGHTNHYTAIRMPDILRRPNGIVSGYGAFYQIGKLFRIYNFFIMEKCLCRRMKWLRALDYARGP